METNPFRPPASRQQSEDDLAAPRSVFVGGVVGIGTWYVVGLPRIEAALAAAGFEAAAVAPAQRALQAWPLLAALLALLFLGNLLFGHRA